MQSCITLSSTEAEYIAAAQCLQEMLFLKQVLEEINQNLKLPMKIMIDNTAAMELGNKWSAGKRTKHIDVRYHLLRDMINVGIFELDFVRSENNVADIFTKNVSEELFWNVFTRS